MAFLKFPIAIFTLILLTTFIDAATFEIRNNCSYTVWAAAVPGGGQRLDSGQTWAIGVVAGTTNARIWARTNCIFDESGRGSCLTGDCEGLLRCQGFGSPPNTVAEYALNQFGSQDFFDISLVLGFNVAMNFSPMSNRCTRGIRCTADINGQCPTELRTNGGCNNPCTVFKTEQYCCTSGAGGCGPTNFSKFFKERCPDAYSYPLDDQNSTFTCPTGTNYRVMFCPGNGNFTQIGQCGGYNECGAYGICDTNITPACKCMPGFFPKNSTAWSLRDGSDGCIRNNNLKCKDDGFSVVKNTTLPDTSDSFVDVGMSLDNCREMCLRNCSCTGYANLNKTKGGSGCVIWATDLIDTRQYATTEGEQDLYYRVAAIDSDEGQRNAPKRGKRIIIIACISAGAALLMSGLCVYFLSKRGKMKSSIRNKRRYRGKHKRSRCLLWIASVFPGKRKFSNGSTTDEVDLPLFDFSTIERATENFSDANKLGRGGFGIVYKGTLGEGQEIAVKRLSRTSGQGIEEFKNEVKLIARLQHRNLVRLLGCCTDNEEKILIYEYMEHKSLDYKLFHGERSSELNWQRRFNIICGVARGLLYLHQDSRFRIIHRDLKAGNVLLDKELNPKISDFGMARICGGDETEANTKRVVGTYGYMAPEYAMDGLFSVKSDVFSFGVLVLEIVSGKKNRGFYFSDHLLNLLGYAWKLFKDGQALELMDSIAGDSFSPDQVMRCIQVGLLCVQERAEDRPDMATVVLMLSSETLSLPQPKQPGFALGTRPNDGDSPSGRPVERCTLNLVTVTTLDGR